MTAPDSPRESFLNALQQQLEGLRAQGLWRELRTVNSAQGPEIVIGGRKLLNFSANDYLGLASHPALKAAASAALERYGTGSGASRLICGSLASHHELEERLAQFKNAEAALSFSSGYATAVGAIGALLDKEDVIVLDKLVHASIVDAARLCGARLRVFAHNDLDDLEHILQWADQARPAAVPAASTRRRRVLIVTESVFSMDGDVAPLREIVALKEKYGAWLMVDEAHATGLLGPGGRGLAEALGVRDRVEVHMGTLGKAIGSAGGYIAGPRALVDLLVNRARSFIFSTAPMPAMAAAAAAGVALIQAEEGEQRRASLWARVDQLLAGLAELSWPVPARTSAILPLIVGAEARAVALAAELRQRGLFVPAIRYPTVARGAARLRVTVSADHTSDQVTQLLAALRDAAQSADAGV